MCRRARVRNRDNAFMATWTCDFCGATGETPESATADQVLCHACAEPVVPDDPSGRVRLGE
jgi:hypothetical protein